MKGNEEKKGGNKNKLKKKSNKKIITGMYRENGRVKSKRNNRGGEKSVKIRTNEERAMKEININNSK